MPTGISRPPPRPWITRNATSMPMLEAIAHRAEPMVNSTREVRYVAGTEPGHRPARQRDHRGQGQV